ncbi:SDR family oxidoreductase [Lentzea sp. NPDC058436]|uniref:SDR family oxidoreductase n=1 Tax=Lentzea sp. NPDC058436 TaxID=3346499 RepID=UPI00365E7A38
MIIVSGATGQLGAQVVERLLERVPASRVGVSVRDVGKAAALAERGVRVRRGDFADPDSLAETFEGAAQVLLVSTNDTRSTAVERHVNAIEAARAAGVERIFYTSHQGAASDSLFRPMPDHAATEEALAKSGVPFTSLRNGYYASTIPLLFGRALETGELVAPADGPVSWTAHADLSEVAAILLAGEESFDGPTPPLTAHEALDLEDVAVLLSEITGRTFRRVVVDDEEWSASLVRNGVPEDRADLLLGMFLASRRGEFTTTGDQLEKLLRRPVTPLRAVLEKAVQQ